MMNCINLIGENLLEFSFRSEKMNYSELVLSSSDFSKKIENCLIDKFSCAGGFVFLPKNKPKNDLLSCNTGIFKLHENLRNSQQIYTQLLFVSAEKYEPIYCSGKCAGYFFDCGDFEQIFIFGLCPNKISAKPAHQAEEIFKKFQSLLAKKDFSFLNVVRTWFYNKDILDWYQDFNHVRTSFFKQNNVFEHLVPASTGIGTVNLQGAAICAGLHAIKAKNNTVRAYAVESPLQDSALKYRSSFSRAVEIQFPDWRKLYVSGTASINKKGESINIGNCHKQIAETMKIVEALLNSRDMHWNNVSRAIAYFKKPDDIPLFSKYIEERKLPLFPYISVNAEICRHELLFEIELDAIRN